MPTKNPKKLITLTEGDLQMLEELKEHMKAQSVSAAIRKLIRKAHIAMERK